MKGTGWESLQSCDGKRYGLPVPHLLTSVARSLYLPKTLGFFQQFFQYAEMFFSGKEIALKAAFMVS